MKQHQPPQPVSPLDAQIAHAVAGRPDPRVTAHERRTRDEAFAIVNARFNRTPRTTKK